MDVDVCVRCEMIINEKSTLVEFVQVQVALCQTLDWLNTPTEKHVKERPSDAPTCVLVRFESTVKLCFIKITFNTNIGCP